MLDDILRGRSLTEADARATMDEVLTGAMEPARLAGLLVALRAKGPSVDELVGFATSMRTHSTRVDAPPPILDNCGTGGAQHKTLNISTTAAFVAAAAGIRVAKHGNRSITRPSGSADILEAAGARLDLPVERVEAILRDHGIAFLFAPAFHPAMKHAGPVRQALGIPTVFNLLGPLTNPAGATHQVLGVGDPDHAPLLAQALGRLGCKQGLVLHGGGFDEATPTGPATGFLVRGEQEPEPWSWDPPVARTSAASLAPVPRDQALVQLQGILQGAQGPVADTVALNAGLALWIAGKASDPDEGTAQAKEILANGAGKAKWDAFVAATNT